MFISGTSSFLLGSLSLIIIIMALLSFLETFGLAIGLAPAEPALPYVVPFALAVPSRSSSLLWATFFLISCSLFRYLSSSLSLMLESLELFARTSFLLGYSEDDLNSFGGPGESGSEFRLLSRFLSTFSCFSFLITSSLSCVECLIRGKSHGKVLYLTGFCSARLLINVSVAPLGRSTFKALASSSKATNSVEVLSRLCQSKHVLTVQC